MNRKDEALRVAAKAFMIIRYGGYLTPDDAKNFEWLCCLALPMRYRFERSEIEAIKNGVAHALADQAIAKNGANPEVGRENE
jgi:hypothetical protein